MAAVTAAVVAGGLGYAAAGQDRKSVEKSTESAERQRAESIAFIDKSIKQARGDLFKLFPSTQRSMTTGFQGGLDVFNQAFPQQLQAFQGGNVAAQNQLIAGLQPQRAAILGQDINFNPQATQLQTPVLQGTLPEFGSIDELGLQASSPAAAAAAAAGPGAGLQANVTSGALVPHKDHFHTPDGRKVSASELMTFSNPAGAAQQLQGIDPQLAQQLIAEYQASQGSL